LPIFVKDGVLVRAVLKGFNSREGRFKAGDVIVKVDGEKVTTPREISSLLHGTRSKNFPVTWFATRKSSHST
jgi:S1-C subfamily serine protease